MDVNETHLFRFHGYHPTQTSSFDCCKLLHKDQCLVLKQMTSWGIPDKTCWTDSLDGTREKPAQAGDMDGNALFLVLHPGQQSSRAFSLAQRQRWEERQRDDCGEGASLETNGCFCRVSMRSDNDNLALTQSP